MLQACLNGGLTQAAFPGVPVTPAELAADAKAVQAAGAAALHLHPRNADGAESLAPSDVAAALDAVRAAVPGMPVGIGSGAWIEPRHQARHPLIRQWQVMPDYVSVNLNEADAPEVMAILMAKGIGIEAGVWTAADAARLVDIGLGNRCLRILLEMITEDPEVALTECRAAMAILAEAGIDRPLLIHGQGGSAWAMVAFAKAHGHDTRIGFEDVQVLPDGSAAETNAALVAAAVEILS